MNRVLVLVPDADTDDSSSWELIENVRIPPKAEHDSLLTSIQSGHSLADSQPIIADLSVQEKVRMEEITRYLESGCTVLIDPFTVRPGPELLRRGVMLSVPILYTPSIYETLLLARSGSLGGIAGVDIVKPAPTDVSKCLYLLYFLLGQPSGARRSADGDWFLWTNGSGCTLRAAGVGSIEMRLVFKAGEVRANDAGVVAVYPAGKRKYNLPLPEGDGLYYNRREIVERLLEPGIQPVYTRDALVAAARWVWETVDEGT